MNRSLIITALAIAFVAGVFLNLPATQAQDVPYERAMWPVENRYVAAFIAGDVDALDSLWHDDLAIWPDGEDRPWSKRYARKRFNRWSGAQDGQLSTPMLEPIAAKIMDDVAVTHYRLEYTVTTSDGTKTQRRLRITHTWVKDGEEWKLLGGSNTAFDH